VRLANEALLQSLQEQGCIVRVPPTPPVFTTGEQAGSQGFPAPQRVSPDGHVAALPTLAMAVPPLSRPSGEHPRPPAAGSGAGWPSAWSHQHGMGNPCRRAGCDFLGRPASMGAAPNLRHRHWAAREEHTPGASALSTSPENFFCGASEVLPTAIRRFPADACGGELREGCWAPDACVVNQQSIVTTDQQLMSPPKKQSMTPPISRLMSPSVSS
jgi:hypothetical protein